MMGNMHCPEQADLMIPPVQPVIKEVLSEDQEEPIGKDVCNRYPVMPVAGVQYKKIYSSEEQIDPTVQEHQVEIGQGIFPGIQLTMPVIAQQDFRTDDENV